MSPSLHRHGMWLNPETGEVRTMQGWKDFFDSKRATAKLSALEERMSFEKWFEYQEIRPVTVYLVHEP